MIVGGIDPGAKGGLSLIDGSMRIISVHHVPSDMVKKNGKQKRMIDFPVWVRQWAEPLRSCDIVVLEQVGAMPDQGRSSMFNFGYAAGFALAQVCLAGARAEFMTPHQWKGAVGIGGSDKGLSFQKVHQLFPGSADLFKRKTVDEGVAEATLMAVAGLRKFRDELAELDRQMAEI